MNGREFPKLAIRDMKSIGLVCTVAVWAAASSAEVATSIVESGMGYSSWPMIQAVGDRLVCVYSRGTVHSIDQGVRDAFAKWSTDGGRTWSRPVAVAASPEYGETPIGKGLDKTGAALFWVRAYGGSKPHHELYRTTDGERFELISTPELSPLPMQITDVFAVDNGLMCLWFATRYSRKVSNSSWGTLFSADNGRTWKQTVVESNLPIAELPTEPSVARIPDGRLLCIARCETLKGDGARQWQMESADGGLTWTRKATNIRDVFASTPSLLFDATSGLLYNYYYERGKGTLKRRVAKPGSVVGNPLAWPEPEVVARGSDAPWDAGNANATSLGNVHYIAFYSGKEDDTSVVVAPVPAAMAFFASIDLSGLWHVEGVGVSGDARLPGTLADAKLGQRWTREMFETTKDRPQSGALVREWQHLGEATYSRVFELSEAESARPLELFLERVMWASRVEIDGRDLGGQDSLSTPHVYRVGKLAAGRHEIRVAVDNSCRYGFSRNSHSYGPSGQSVWHGVIGRIELRPVDPFASVKVFASAPSGGKVVVKGLPDGFGGTAKVEELETASVSRDGDDLVLALASEPVYWSESTPRLYTLVLSDGDCERRIRFGFRTYGTTRHAVTVNGAKTFIRANIDNCLFPKLGRPPTAKSEWLDILRVLKEEDGFNAIRFHSWCPPEAAFDAADELGMYLQPEVCIWSDKWMKPAPQHVGWGDPVDGFVRREFRAICDAYANHPSFLSLAVGNELGGSNWDEAERIVREMRAYEPRALHFFSSARAIVPSDQLTATHNIPSIGMCRERLFPNTDWDYEDVYAKASIPVIAHEIGQWPPYPDFAGLLPKFDGVMRPWNIDRCEVRSRREGTDRFWREYMAASAHQSRLIYKDEVESFLRTPSCAGVHLLDAQDYTGEGEALMGWRDPFFSLKPAYRDMKPFRSAWAREAALARIAKYDWCVGETFEARLQVRNQGTTSIAAGREFEWSIVDCSDGSTAARGSFRLPCEVAPGELGDVGTVRFPVVRSCDAKLELRFGENAWSFWAFPSEGKAAVPDGVTVADDFSTMRETLSRGGTVLYTGRSRESAEDSFKPVYWSSVWFPTKQPLKETLGIWFEKGHPMLAGFPTEEHSDWQWYGLVNGAIIHRLTGLSQSFRPVALSVNDFHFSLLASSLFELKVGAGRLVVCGYDLESDAPATRRLRASVFEYLSRPPAEGTVEVPLSWLDGFAPLAADGSAALEVVYSEDVDFCGRVFERDVKLSEPVTGFFELEFGATEMECSGRGSVDGHSFDIPKGRGNRVVRVGIIREDMLDGKLSVCLESTDDAPLRLMSLRVVRR